MITGKVHKNLYRDSIALMRIANQLLQKDGVCRAEVLIATPANLAALQNGGMMTAETLSATPNDVVVVVEADDQLIASAAMEEASDLINGAKAAPSSTTKSYFSLETAQENLPQANLVLFSIPGVFVKREALKALEKDLNLMIFSDNVPLVDEIEIKRVAEQKGLLVMGPDCGTALIGGVGLGFANQVARGEIGVVAASGTGLQEVTCLIDRAGLGVSHGIGTGSNDVKSDIGAVSLLRGVQMLEDDPTTRVILVVTKPPDDVIERKVLAKISECQKPVVVCFLGGDSDAIRKSGALAAGTLEEAARMAVKAAGGSLTVGELDQQKIQVEASRLANSQRYVRGVFSGGTFVTESALILSQYLGPVFTNTGLPQAQRLEDATGSIGHTCIDLGEDQFTQGKPHPMLDPLMRKQRILQEAKDPQTAVLLLDFVLGHGAHPDPVGAITSTLKAAREQSAVDGRYLPIFASVCGTEADPQMRSQQVALLEELGALVFDSNAQATRAVLALVEAIEQQGVER